MGLMFVGGQSPALYRFIPKKPIFRTGLSIYYSQGILPSSLAVISNSQYNTLQTFLRCPTEMPFDK